MKRGVKTAADYAAIAVAPVLIFIMISSLVNFLSLVMYRGNFPERIQWTFLMVTLGSVAAARLSIEEDRSKSLMYLFALAGAALFVLLRFVANPVFSVVMLGLIAWLSDVIVRDCTLIDESKDSSDQGLVQTSRRGGHRPGRTVLFLAIAALPLFGVGQFFLRSHAGAWLGAQKLLALYLFAALSLLVTTSFLGLRRYLRQRGSEMPTNVTVAWLAGGLLMVMAILLIATLAPMPGQAIASMEVPDWMTATDDPKSSRYGWGNEGTENETEGAAKIQSPEPKSEPKSAPSQKGAPPGAAKDGDASKGPAGKQSGGKKPSSGKDSSGKEEASQGESKSKSGESKPSDDSPGEKPSKDGKPQSSPEAKSSDSDAKTESQTDGPQQGDQGKSESKRSQPDSSDDQKPPPSESPSPESPTESGDSPSDRESSPPDQKQEPGESNEPSDSGNAGEPQDTGEPSDSNGPPDSGDPSEPSDSSEDRDPSEPSESAEPSEPNEADPSTDDSEPSESSQQESSDPSESESDQPESDQPEESPEPDEGSEPDGSPKPDESSEPEQAEAEESSGPSALMRLLALLAGALRPLILIACLGVVGYFLWQNWPAIASWWANLFRREAESPDAPAAPSGPQRPATPPKPFASFANPFQTSADPRQSVLVTFDALEAFARERGVARTADETPIEFYGRMKSHLPELASGSSTVIDSYNRLLYGGLERPTAADLRAAEALWKQMLGGATRA